MNGPPEGGAPEAGDESLLEFSEPEPPDLEEVYTSALRPLQFGTFDCTLPRAYNRWGCPSCLLVLCEV